MRSIIEWLGQVALLISLFVVMFYAGEAMYTFKTWLLSL